jgi:BON domain
MDNLENDSLPKSDELREYRRNDDDDRGIPAGVAPTAQPDPTIAQPPPATLDQLYVEDETDDDYDDADAEELDEMISGAAEQPMSSNADVLNLGDRYLVSGEEAGYDMGFGDPYEEEGTTDVQAAIEDGVTYFAPIDPPVDSRLGGREGAGVAGGFAGSSLDEIDAPAEELDPVLNPRRVLSDDDLAAAVVRALAADSYTTDLPIEVSARNGVVYLRGRVNSMDDADMAAAVAGEVSGVLDVNDDDLEY